jgi:hypothetical protein
MASYPPTRVLAALALATAAFFTACKNSTGSPCASGSPRNLVGTYAELSYTIGANTVAGSSVASGQLRLYATAYGFNAVIPTTSGGTQAFADSGTYALSGASCIAWTSVLGQPVLTGTYTVVVDTLAVTGTAATETVSNLWIKQ